jgi:peptidoglycan hydrolase CwlO-like protein
MSTNHAPRRRIRRLVVAVSAAVLTFTGVTSAFGSRVSAAPIDNKQQQAAALEAEINANGERLGVLYEQIKYTQDKLDRASQAIAETQARIGSGSGKVVYQTVSYYRGAVRPG